MPRKYLLKKECVECSTQFETKHLHQTTCSKKCGITLLRRRELEMNERNGISQVWACGGGVQSTAIAALIYMGELPKPNYAYMIDVGYERTGTFDYANRVLIPKLADIAVELKIIKTTDYFDNSLFDKQMHCKLPLFKKTEDGLIIKFRTHCSGKWKQAVAAKWLRSQGVKRCDTWLGISVDEARRVKSSRFSWNQNRYPLVEFGFRREDCVDLAARLGWPKPEHTSCFLCSNQSDFSWQDTKQHYPNDWEKAIEADEYIRSIDCNLFLHGSCKPLKEKAFNIHYMDRSFVGKECFGDCESTNWKPR